MNSPSSFPWTPLIVAFLAMALVGCGKSSPEALIESAKSFSAKGDHKAAAIQLRNVLQKQPDNGQARFLLGRAMNEQLDFVGAEKELRKALEHGVTADGVYAALALAPENALIMDTYGWILLQSGDVKRAVEPLTLAAQRVPKDPDIRLHLAKARIEAKDNAGARKEVKILLQLPSGAPQRAEAEQLRKRL